MKTAFALTLATLLFASLTALPPADSNAAKPQLGQASRLPNFIVIFIDDLGYADVQPFSDRHDTPHLARMAREGRKFTNFYVASSVCTPSRAAIMTGCYPARVSMLYNETRRPLPHASVLWPGDPKGLNPDEVTIAEVLKDRGYATACIGKWHLGDQPSFLPTRQGFDEFFGIPNGHDMGVRSKPFNLPPPMVKNEIVIEELGSEDFPYLTKRYTEYALARSYVQKLGDEGMPGTEVRKAGYVKIAHPMNWKE
ncbi:MAG: sulfatase-like hydrolase/transferase [Rhodothermia bacterium]